MTTFVSLFQYSLLNCSFIQFLHHYFWQVRKSEAGNANLQTALEKEIQISSQLRRPAERKEKLLGESAQLLSDVKAQMKELEGEVSQKNKEQEKAKLQIASLRKNQLDLEDIHSNCEIKVRFSYLFNHFFPPNFIIFMHCGVLQKRMLLLS